MHLKYYKDKKFIGKNKKLGANRLKNDYKGYYKGFLFFKRGTLLFYIKRLCSLEKSSFSRKVSGFYNLRPVNFIKRRSYSGEGFLGDLSVGLLSFSEKYIKVCRLSYRSFRDSTNKVRRNLGLLLVGTPGNSIVLKEGLGLWTIYKSRSMKVSGLVGSFLDVYRLARGMRSLSPKQRSAGGKGGLKVIIRRVPWRLYRYTRVQKRCALQRKMIFKNWIPMHSLVGKKHQVRQSGFFVYNIRQVSLGIIKSKFLTNVLVGGSVKLKCNLTKNLLSYNHKNAAGCRDAVGTSNFLVTFLKSLPLLDKVISSKQIFVVSKFIIFSSSYLKLSSEAFYGYLVVAILVLGDYNCVMDLHKGESLLHSFLVHKNKLDYNQGTQHKAGCL